MNTAAVSTSKEDRLPGSAEERKRVGATVRALRQARGATIEQFAHRVGISRPLLANIEAGRRNLKAEKLPIFAEALGVPQIAIMWPDYDEHTFTSTTEGTTEQGAA